VFCSKCGTAVPADSAFCTACGTPQAPRSLGTPPPGSLSVHPNVGVAGYSAPRGQFLYAGFWIRFVAYLIDGVIQGFAILAFCIPVAAITGAAANLQILSDASRYRHMERLDPVVVAALLSVIFTFVAVGLLITWLYYAYSESSTWQATVGKRVMNIYVTDLNGQRITFLNATGRYFA
jgi:uncharacterized RDD family membrane protein YckC